MKIDEDALKLANSAAKAVRYGWREGKSLYKLPGNGDQIRAAIEAYLEAASSKWIEGNTPTVEGWYRVLHPGDSESIDGHTIYEYSDYEGWAYWSNERVPQTELLSFSDQAPPVEVTSIVMDASWSCEHDEDGESILMYCGPFLIPDRLPLST